MSDHRFWAVGEPDCPPDIKAGNGELRILRCKVCGLDNPLHNFCSAAQPVREPWASLLRTAERRGMERAAQLVEKYPGTTEISAAIRALAGETP